jgi:N-acetylglutamate synthase-like GNAT family acetyltransferase
MPLAWIHESPAKWDADKTRVIGRAPVGVFDARYAQAREGDLVPGEWWRVEEEGRTIGYGWLDVNWGDAEVLLATDPEARGRGVGTFILLNLEAEAFARGLNYLYNVVRSTHPERDKVTEWLAERGFTSSEDGRLMRAVVSRDRISRLSQLPPPPR